MLDRLFKPRPAQIAGRALYTRAVRQARTPALYSDLGAPDTHEGRFELYSLHVYLVLERLKDQGPRAAETGQAMFDAYVKALDDALREMGVGDMSVGKKIRKLGEAFYGRIKSYEEALVAAPDPAPLEAVLTRTVFAEADAGRVGDLATYVLAQRRHLAGQSVDALCAGDLTWSAL